jgi:putative flippase GtrA
MRSNLPQSTSSKLKKATAFCLDLPYPIFKRLMSFELYRYLAVGGICFLLNMMIFHIVYYYLLHYTPTENIFFNNNLKSLLSSMCVTVPTGFYLIKNFVFSSVLNEKKQFFRYSISSIASVFLSKKLLDFFIINLHLQVTIALLLSITIIQVGNFFFQRKVSFK